MKAISWDSCIVFLKLARFFVVAWSIFATGRICIQIWYHVQAAVNITAQTTAATASYTFGSSFGYSIGNWLSGKFGVASQMAAPPPPPPTASSVIMKAVANEAHSLVTPWLIAGGHHLAHRLAVAYM